MIGILRPEFTGLSDSPRDVWIPFTTYAAAGESRSARRRSAAGCRDHRAAEARDDRGAGPGGVDAVHGRVVPAQRRRPCRRHPARDAEPAVAAAGGRARAGVCGVRPRARRRVRQRVQRDAGARRVAASRDCRAAVARRQPRPARAAAADRRPADCGAGRRRRPGARRVAAARRHGGVLRARCRRRSPCWCASRRSTSTIRVFVFCLAVCAVAPLLFALLPALQASRLTLMDVLRGHGAGALERLAASQPARRQPGGDRHRPGDPGGDAGAQRRGDRRHRPRLPAGGRALDQHKRRGHRRRSAGWPRCCAPIRASPKSPRATAIRCSSSARDVAASPSEQRAPHGTRYTFVTPEYFSLLQIPIDAAAASAPTRRAASARVAIVSAATAREFWPERGSDRQDHPHRAGRRPAGRRSSRLLRRSPSSASPATSSAASSSTAGTAATSICRRRRDSPRVSALLVRGRTPGEPSAEVLDGLFRQVAADPQLFEALPLDELRALQIYPLRAASWIGSLLAAVALALSVAGLYGVLSFTIGQRTREIGIRMALGATGTSVVRLVVRYSMRLAGVGASSASSRRSSRCRCSARPFGCARFRWWTARRSPPRSASSWWRPSSRPTSRRAAPRAWTRRRRCGRRAESRRASKDARPTSDASRHSSLDEWRLASGEARDVAGPTARLHEPDIVGPGSLDPGRPRAALQLPFSPCLPCPGARRFARRRWPSRPRS